MDLTHLDAAGRARMVDVGAKPPTQREATASGRIVMRRATLAQIVAGGLPKGDVLAAARIAGIQAAKQTAQLIPLCHPLALTRVVVDIAVDDRADEASTDAPHGQGAASQGTAALRVTATVAAHGPTGVEMEALTAVSVALLTIYDMAKAVERGMVLTDVGLDSKTGGQNGPWVRGARSEAVIGAASTGTASAGTSSAGAASGREAGAAVEDEVLPDKQVATT